MTLKGDLEQVINLTKELIGNDDSQDESQVILSTERAQGKFLSIYPHNFILIFYIFGFTNQSEFWEKLIDEKIYVFA